ncbi:MAG: hypothetical protein A2521_07380 [Deltaproteobacteria bacterium RIFOXYD12_FULL_57_12]|nr:MAG: hypothetical protein A2521_07380 [Deltaproteobacteria bacterium RIFOXYD12_FULL_57_12]
MKFFSGCGCRFLSLPGFGGSNYTNDKINHSFLNIELSVSLRHSLFLVRYSIFFFIFSKARTGEKLLYDKSPPRRREALQIIILSGY